MKWDLTELDPLDDLHLPRGAIKEAQGLAAQLFRASKTFFMINGVTGGLLALFMAFAPPGRKVLLTRLAHKAVLHGIALSGARPVYLPIEKEPSTNFPLNVSPQSVEKGLLKNPETALVLVTSPSYWGVAADLPALRKVTEKFGAILAIDEAHGGHFPFYGDRLPHGAMAGVDLWLHSAHKSLGSLTPGALLHLGKKISSSKIGFWLQVMQTSSPSYPVMISLDLMRRQMALRGEEMFSRLWDWGQTIRRGLSARGFAFLQVEKVEEMGFYLDPCRITLLFPRGGGHEFARLLAKRGYQVELEAGGYLLAIGGPAQLGRSYSPFLRALVRVRSLLDNKNRAIAAQLPPQEFPPTFFAGAINNGEGNAAENFSPFPLSPRQALQAPPVSVLLEKAVGEICAEMVVVSPPGIPIIAPGEIIGKNVVHFLREKRAEGVFFQGVKDPTLKWITVVKKC